MLIREVKGLEDNPYPPLLKSDGTYSAEVQLCIDAAAQMEKDGVRAIAMCCGFFSLIQPVVAEHVGIPIMTSPLMMIPIIHQLLRSHESVLVVTAAARLLSNDFFQAVGADLNDRVTMVGLDNSACFNAMCMGGNKQSFEYEELRDDVLAAIAEGRARDPNIGAILLECTTLPAFAAELREATKLPVFDFVAFVEWMHRAVVPKQHSGYI
ncbi:aspartate/glutamate racemase family protein [Defluviimonas sp. D31]|uniref:aspartate/glutamate racemase family protein n=1 Tax=Defluviimonas sp. D31 TaxID=3083253 RepID=UPI00296E43B2|nr:aspartate/glutamate racemase family protein [Defluviimonas sp. D31]